MPVNKFSGLIICGRCSKYQGRWSRVSWVYRSITQAKPGAEKGDFTRFEVGYRDGPMKNGDNFKVVETYDDRHDARRAVHYLNGGEDVRHEQDMSFLRHLSGS